MYCERWLKISAVLCVVALLIAGCSTIPKATANPTVNQGATWNNKIRIAGQFGLLYSPLIVAQEMKLFEKYGVEVEWQQYGSGGTTREALVANQVDVAFMATAPFLIGWDKGVPAKIAMGFNTLPCAMVTNDPNIKSIHDIPKDAQIAVPSPGSVQDIMLSMGAKREFGNPQYFQNNLVALPHPDAMAALLAKRDIVAHFATPPFLFEELSQPGFQMILSDVEAFGSEYSFNVAVVTEKFRNDSPVAYSVFIHVMNEAMAWINENKQEAAVMMAPHFNLTPEKTLEYLNWPGMNFTSAPYGLMGWADFMKDAGFISKVPKELSEIAFENVLAVVGSRAGGPSVYEQLQMGN